MQFVRRHRFVAVIATVVLVGMMGWAASALFEGIKQPQSLREQAEEALQEALRADIDRYKSSLTSTTDPTQQAEVRLALAERCLDTVPGEEVLAAKQALEVLNSDVSQDKLVRAKLILAESYRSWRYQALKLYTEVIDEHPGTEWEAWAKIGMARTLAAEATGLEPGFQCEEAVELLEQVLAQCPGTECARAARRVLPPIRAYFDFPGAVEDLELIAAGLEDWEIDDMLRQMTVFAANGGARCGDLAALFEQAALDAAQPIATLAAQWAESFSLPLTEAIGTLAPYKLKTVFQVRLIHKPRLSSEELDELREHAPELIRHAPEQNKAWGWIHFGKDAYWAGDVEKARMCLQQAKECYFQYDQKEYSLSAANGIARLAEQVGDGDTTIEVLEDAMERWPDNHLSDRTLIALAQKYDEVGLKDVADQLYTQLVTEFPRGKHLLGRCEQLKERLGIDSCDGCPSA